MWLMKQRRLTLAAGAAVMTTSLLLLSLIRQLHPVTGRPPAGSDGITTSFPLEHCDCVRTLVDTQVTQNVSSGRSPILFNQTTCSRDAFQRGPGQKVVAFSFYGDVNSSVSKAKGYFEGIVGNLELMPIFYPGWVMRLYYDLNSKDPLLTELCNLACTNPILDICDAAHLPGTPFVDASKVFAMNWRFFPTLDPQVDVLVSRDLDSRLSDRERDAVVEWLQSASTKPFHFMRDHPEHGTTILGSGWGVQLTSGEVRRAWTKSWLSAFEDPILWAPRHSHGPDQVILDKYIWPWAKSVAVSHDSYLCNKYPRTQPFPSQRKQLPNNFIASVVTENITLTKECPISCRPKKHPDWIHC